MNAQDPLIEDTFFESPEQAKKIAKQQNIMEPYHHLQICYYTGKKIASSEENLIHLPSDFPAYLLNLGTRPPTQIIKQDGSVVLLPKPYVQNLKHQVRATSGNICQFSQGIIEQLSEYSALKQNHYQKLLVKNAHNKLNFNEKLRIYIGADYGAKIVLNMYRIIRDAAISFGYEVMYDENSNIELMDDYRRLKSIERFKPHITININRVRNQFLNSDTFNFIWFQDNTLVVVDDSEIKLRARDSVYYLIDDIYQRLQIKSVNAKRQDFFLSPEVFKERPEINRSESKIVFIGSSYKSRLEKYSRTDNLKKLTQKLLKLFKENWNVTESKLDTLLSSAKLTKADYNAVPDFNIHEILDYINRDIFLEEVLKYIDGYELEIYGDGWENNSTLQPYYKGSLEYGEAISKQFNQAKFSLVPGGGYILQLRVIEAVHSGCIPLAFDNRCSARIEPPYYEDAICYFNSPKQLQQQLLNATYSKKDLTNIKKDTQAKSFFDKIHHVVQHTLQISEKIVKDTSQLI